MYSYTYKYNYKVGSFMFLCIYIYIYVYFVYLYISQSFNVVNLANFADTKNCLTLLAKVESIR